MCFTKPFGRMRLVDGQWPIDPSAHCPIARPRRLRRKYWEEEESELVTPRTFDVQLRCGGNVDALVNMFGKCRTYRDSILQTYD